MDRIEWDEDPKVVLIGSMPLSEINRSSAPPVNSIPGFTGDPVKKYHPLKIKTESNISVRGIQISCLLEYFLKSNDSTSNSNIRISGVS